MCARLVETPVDNPGDPIAWDIAAIDVPGARLEVKDSYSAQGVHWARACCEPRAANGPEAGRRWMGVELLPGRYQLQLRSATFDRTVDLTVPAGDGRLNLPDISLRTRASIATVGKPAAEIEALDLDDKPVRLADYKGQVVALHFWSSTKPYNQEEIAQLIDISKRHFGGPLTILVLHDATVTSADAYEKVLAPVWERFGKALPIRFLRDRPADSGPGAPGRPASGDSLGRTHDAYEFDYQWPTLVINANGRLVCNAMESATTDVCVGVFSCGQGGKLDRLLVPGLVTGEVMLRWAMHGPAMERALFDGRYARDSRDIAYWLFTEVEAAIDEQLGRPRPVRLTRLDEFGREVPNLPMRPMLVAGKVIGPAGEPVAGAQVTVKELPPGQNELVSNALGEFRFAVADEDGSFRIDAQAGGFAPQVFFCRVEPMARGIGATKQAALTHRLSEPLALRRGVSVRGRVLRDAKAVGGFWIGLPRDETGRVEAPNDRETRTDESGVFQFDGVLPESTLSVCPVLGKVGSGETIELRSFHTRADGTTLELGDLATQPGRRLAGRVVLPEGKPIPVRIELTATSLQAQGSTSVEPDATGRFEFQGLPSGDISVGLSCRDAAVRGAYRLSAKNKCLNLRTMNHIEGRLERDIADLTILVEPGEPIEPPCDFADLTSLADFYDAQSGPITGVLPAEYPPR